MVTAVGTLFFLWFKKSKTQPSETSASGNGPLTADYSLLPAGITRTAPFSFSLADPLSLEI